MMEAGATHCGALVGGLFVVGESLGQRLKNLRGERGLSQAELAKLVGVTRAAIGMYEQGKRSPDYDILRRLAEVFMVSADYLLGLPQGATPLGPMVRIPVLGVIRAGDPIFAEQNTEGYEHVPEEEARGGEYFYLRVTGDSMSGARIEAGDLVYVRRQDWVSGTGDIAVVIVNAHDACLKRLAVQDGKAILYSDNPAYPPQIHELKDIRVIGRVVHVKFRPK